jgi:hypothetical protein
MFFLKEKTKRLCALEVNLYAPGHKNSRKSA